MCWRLVNDLLNESGYVAVIILDPLLDKFLPVCLLRAVHTSPFYDLFWKYYQTHQKSRLIFALVMND